MANKTYINKLSKFLQKNPKVPEAAIGAAILASVQSTKKAEAAEGQAILDRVKARKRQDKMENGNILDRAVAGFQQGNDEAKAAQQKLDRGRAPTLKEGLLDAVNPLNERNVAAANRVATPVVRATSAATMPVIDFAAKTGQKGLEVASAPLQWLINKTIFAGEKGEKRRQKAAGAVVGAAQKGIDAYQGLDERTKDKIGNYGRFAENIAAFTSLPGAKSLAGAGAKLTSKAIAKTPGTSVVAKGLKDASETQLGKIFNATKEVNKAKTGQVVKQITAGKEKLPFAFTRKGLLEKLGKKTDEVGALIGETEDAGGIQGTTKRETLMNYLKEQKDKYLLDTDQESKDVFRGGTTPKSLDEFISNPDVTPEGSMIVDVDGKQKIIVDPKAVQVIGRLEKLTSAFADDIPNTFLQKFKKKFYNKINTKGGYMKTTQEGTELDIEKDFAGLIREEIAKSNPDLDALNKKFAFYVKARDVLGETLERKTGQSGIVSQFSAAIPGTVVGAVSGGAGGAALPAALGAAATYGLYKTVTSTGWRQISAKLKTKLANAMVSGNKTSVAQILKQIDKELVTKGFAASTVPAAGQEIQQIQDQQLLK